MGVVTTTLIGLAAVAAIGASLSQGRQAEKQQQNLVRDAQAAQAVEAAKTQEQIKALEAETIASKKQMQEAPAIAAEQEREEAIRRRAARAKTLLTTPQGVLGEATVGKKVLLGG